MNSFSAKSCLFLCLLALAANGSGCGSSSELNSKEKHVPQAIIPLGGNLGVGWEDFAVTLKVPKETCSPAVVEKKIFAKPPKGCKPRLVTNVPLLAKITSDLLPDNPDEANPNYTVTFSMQSTLDIMVREIDDTGDTVEFQLTSDIAGSDHITTDPQTSFFEGAYEDERLFDHTNLKGELELVVKSSCLHSLSANMSNLAWSLSISRGADSEDSFVKLICQEPDGEF